MGSLDYDRQLMLDEHLRRRNVCDQAVLDAMWEVPRERFVTPDMVPMAYADRALPIGHGQTISQPYIVALVAQSLDLSGDENVLEVGAGSGYMAAILGRLARRVIGIEMVEELAWQARERMRELGADHVDIETGDGRRGWLPEAPYDAVVVSAAAPEVPPALVEQLALGGRLIMPLGHELETQQLTRIDKDETGLQSRVLCPCKFVPLLGGW